MESGSNNYDIQTRNESCWCFILSTNLLLTNALNGVWEIVEKIYIEKKFGTSKQSWYPNQEHIILMSYSIDEFITNQHSKVLKKLLLKINQQISCHNQHATVDQIHWIVEVINRVLKGKTYRSRKCLDIHQVFDKI